MNRLIFLLLVAAFWVTPLFAGAVSGSDSGGFSFDDTDETFEAPVLTTDIGSETENRFQKLFDAVFTLSHDYHRGTGSGNRKTITNRSTLRGKADSIASDYFLVHFDGEATFYHPNDHMAEADQERWGNLREFYFQAGFERLTLKAGQQILIWGETDADIINDVVSPRDQSEFIFTDLEDARIGQYMVTAEVYPGPGYGTLSGFLVAKPEGNRLPKPGTAYYTLPESLHVTDKEPDNTDLESGLRWKNTYGSLDLSLMAASLFQNDGILYQQSTTHLERRYARTAFLGFGMNYAAGSCLWKMDAALKKNIDVQAATPLRGLTGKPSDSIEGVAGLDYDANGRYLFSVEISNRYLTNHSEEMLQEKNNTAIYFLFEKSFKNETLNTRYSFFYSIQEDADTHEFEVEYLFTDNLKLKGEYTLITVRETDSLYKAYENDDRVGLKIDWFF